MTDERVGTSLVSFAARSDRPGLCIRDELEDRTFRLGTDRPVSPDSVSTDRFVFPVDAAVFVTASELRTPIDAAAILRDADGDHLGEFTETPREVPEGRYVLELSGATKTYVRLSGASFTGYADRDSGAFVFEFDAETTLDVGARSLHRRPRATVTVPDDPRALLSALSVLGSSVKGFSCERSWPTLRGHPPALAVGDDLSIPPELSAPETGVTITVPPTYADALRVAPLAFYLGAAVEPGSERALHLDVGYTEPLGETGRELERSVDQLLARCLFLDSLTRVGGYYSLPRAEYDEVAAHLPFYPPNLYGRRVSEQLLEYLEVPESVVDPYLPRWPLTAVLRPEPTDVPLLSPLLDSLARVHVGDDGPARPVSRAAVRGYTGRRPPAGAAQLLPAAFEHAREHPPVARERARIRLLGAGVASLATLRRVAGGYADAVADGSGELTRTAAPTRADLRRALDASTVVAVGGETTDDGVVCRDGVLPFADIDRVGAAVVALGGPEAFAGARRLVAAGAVAGLAADRPLAARELGRLGGYLLTGFPLVESARLADLSPPVRFVGDPTTPVVRRAGGQPGTVVEVTSEGEDEHRFRTRPVLSRSDALGGVEWFREEYAQDAYQLFGADVEHPHTLTAEAVAALVRDEEVAVRLNGSVCHTTDADAAAIRRAARRTLDGATD